MKESPLTVDRLALFGGPPLFDSVRPIGQLSVPDETAYIRLVKEAYERGQLSNDGPVVQELERRLAAFHGTKHCVTVANAGLGLIMLAAIFADGRRGEVIMPAFSYRGLPHIVQWAGQLPRFCDVDPATHTLDPRSVEAALSDRTTSILAVCNFNSPGQIRELEGIAARRRLPIVFDSVDALGATYRRRRLGPNGSAEVFSTHATKMLNGFEGGYVTTDDDALADTLRWQREFARPEERPLGLGTAHVVGFGSRFNELHAALALLSLDRIDAIVAANKARAAAYQRGLSGVRGLSLIPYADGDGEISNYRMVVADVGPEWPLNREETIALLRAEGAAIDAYWSPALHRSVHCPEGIAVPSLPVAENLGTRMMHLPVGDLVSVEDVDRICELLRFVEKHGERIAERMRAASIA